MAQWWEHSPPTNVARVRFPVSASYMSWVCYWFLSLLRGFFSGYSGFPPSTKNSISKFQFDLETVERRATPWIPLKLSFIYLFPRLRIVVLFTSKTPLISVINRVNQSCFQSTVDRSSRFALRRLVIGLRNSRHFLNQSWLASKLFTRAWNRLYVFPWAPVDSYVCCDWPDDYFGFASTTVIWKLLYWGCVIDTGYDKMF